MIIYYADITVYPDTFFDAAIICIPRKKRIAIEKINNTGRKKESILAWYLLSYGLNVLGIRNAQISFSKNGKPYIENNSVKFSISHSDGTVCCAISMNEVGIDIECVRNCRERVMEYVLSDNELIALSKSPNKKSDFIKFWTFKESILKNTGEGISGNLKTLDFSEFINCDEFDYYSLHFKSGILYDKRYSISSVDKEYKFCEISYDTAMEYLKNS